MASRLKHFFMGAGARARAPRAAPRPAAEPLEPRILYSADPFGASAGLLDAAEVRLLPLEAATPTVAAESGGSLQADSTGHDVQAIRHEIVFVDSQVPDYAQLVDEISASGETPRELQVVVIGAGEDGLAVIGRTLAAQSVPIDAVHIVSHGQDGAVQLGRTLLDAATAAAHADDIAAWSAALDVDADLLIYGCDVAATPDGQWLMTMLADLTGADVAASTDRTGSADAGGDWQLEFATGSIEETLAPSAGALSSWTGVLPVNTAPVLDTAQSPALNAQTEDAGAPVGAVGTLVSSLVDFAVPAGEVDNVTDPDVGAVTGIAITAADTSQGSWWYSTNDGASWLALGAVSELNARLLAADGVTRLAFQPNANTNGSIANAITFLAWDQTQGSNGGTHDVTTNRSVAEAFNTNDYLGSTGTHAWSSGWIESESGGSNWVGGDIKTQASSLSIKVANVGDEIYRQADLSAAASATLSFTYANALDPTDDVVLRISNNGGGSYVTLASFSGVSNVGSGTYSTDISAYVAANTRIQFYVQAAGSNKTLTVDNVQIAYTVDAKGGSSAFSLQSDTASQVVTAVNDAPVLDSSGTMTLTTINEDQTANAGTTVAAIVASAGGNRITDVDSGAVEGIAVTGLASGNGTWQYSINGGGSWSDVGAVSASSALLLRDTDLLRFVPDALNADSASVSFRAWDQTGATAGQQGTKVDTTTNGGTTPFSTATESASITVTAVNDAPTIANGATVTLAATNEDTPSAATVVSTIVTGASWADVDSGAQQGLAVTSQTGNGTWQYSTDGIAWTAFGSVSGSSALLLGATTQVRYVPDGLNGETAGFAFAAWDQTSGTASTNGSPSTANPGTVGGTSAWSSESASASIIVAALNDAPLLDASGALVLTTITEDQTASAGDTVAAIVASAGSDRITDADPAPLEGIAITGLASGNGTWQYSIDGGGTWNAIGAVSDASALLLRDTDRLRFVPDALDADAANLSFRAWDQTGGTAGQQGTKVDASVNGGTSPFSTATETAAITVTGVNDAPTITNGASVTLSATDEDTPSASVTVDALLSGVAWGDADSAALKGIAVTASTGNGSWEYSVDGVSWTGFGAVGGSSALLLSGATQLRYQPDGVGADAASFSFIAWDRTSGSASADGAPSYAAPGAGGGTTAFSLQSASASISVSSLNDAPVLDNTGAPTMATITENQTATAGATVAAIIASAGGDRITDVDPGAVEGIAVTGLTSGNGTWQYSIDGGGTWQAVGAVSDASALLLRDTDRLRFVPDGLNADAASVSFRAWDQTGATAGQHGSKVDASINGGTTAFSVGAETATIGVSAVNDAPSITDGATVVLAGTDEDTTSPATSVAAILGSASWADVDIGASGGIAVTDTSGSGTWQYSTDGVTWTAFGAVSDSSALLLDAATQVRFVPDGLNAQTATFAFRAWDQTSGTASTNGSPSTADPGSGGDASAFSVESAAASMPIAAVNDAPVLDNTGSPTLTTITEDQAANAGDTVAALVASAGGDRITDVDAGAVEGIAVTGLTSGSGTWQYSTDGGASWSAVGAVSDASALLLRDTDRLRFVPDELNADSASVTYRAWDQSGATAGQQGTQVDASTNGGTTPFSAATETAAITVTAVNDAPTLTNGATEVLAGTDEDTPSTGTTVGTILAGAGWADVDTGALQGLAVTSTSGNGTWEYSTDGVTWTAFGAVSGSGALLLDATTQVRYMPDGLNGEAAGFGFVAWDRTTGSASTNGAPAYGDASSGGGTAAYSTESASASMTVSDVNDAPAIANGAAVSLAPTDQITTSSSTTVDSILGSASWADADIGALKGIAVTSTSGNGTWEYSTDGVTWTGFGAVSGSSALLLDAATQVRYVPDGLAPETASFAFVAWDRTSGSASVNGAPSTANPGAGGGTSAWSSQSATASIVVTDVNDAPVLDNTGAPTLTTVSEDDTANAGVTVAAIVASAGGDRITDLDAGALEGIAVTGTTNGNGTWQYSIDGGGTWNAVGAVSDASALLLRDTDLLRFVPDGLNADSASVSFRAWDRSGATAGQQGAKVDASVNGGIAPFSTATETATVTVTAVNDAPTVTNGAAVTLLGTDENTPSTGTTVDTLLTGASWADVDTGALKGIAVTSASGTGTWEYSTDGLTWTGVGAVSASNALLLDAATQVRYVPDGTNAETASFGFVAWDQTSGAASADGAPVYANPGAGGGTSATSSQAATASIAVAAVNDAPVLDNAGTPTLTPITEDQVANAGDTVAAIIASAGGDRITDVDGGAVEGIAVTGLASGNGTWQYSIDGGGSWQAVGAVADNGALLLRDTDRLRFVPDGLNADAASVSFRAWDQSGATAGQQGTKVDASTNGGTTPFSAATETATIAVADVNDAPVLDTGGTMTLTTLTEDQLANGGDTVAAIVASAGGDRITDVDTGAVEGIAVTGLVSGNGTWQFSTDAGSTWQAVGAVSDASALLLRSTDLLRFVPDGQNADSAGVSFRAWDQSGATAGQQGTKVDASVNGGTSAFSSAAGTAGITVTALNDAPVLDNTGSPTLTTITEDQAANAGDTVAALVASAGGDRITDVDTGAVEGIAVTGLANGNGTWQYSTDGGGTWSDVGAVADNNALLLRESDSLRFVPNALNADAASVSIRAWDQSGATAGQQGTKVDASVNGGTTAFSTDSEIAGITVTAVNDAPTIGNGATVVLSGTDEDTTSTGTAVDTVLAAASWADADAGALKGIAVTGVTGNGTWEYSTDGLNWTGFGTVSASGALLLDAATQVRYVPDGVNAETASFDFVAWDRTSGSPSTNGAPGTGNPGARGGTTAFSIQSAAATLTVAGINDAPVLDAGATFALTTISEDQTASAGDTVAAIVASAGGDRITDVDAAAYEGIAITGITSGNGTWQYSIDAGGTWSDVGAVSDSAALPLCDCDLLRFVPDGLNADNASLSFRAWDRTSGTAGTKVDATANGGTTAFSASTGTAGITVTAVNDAPVITSGPQLGAVEEDGVPSASGVVSASDADSGATASFSGSAGGAYGGFVVDAVSGAWTYTLDNAAAQPLAAGQRVSETFTVTVDDGQGGLASQAVTITIDGRNDAPQITSGVQAGAVVEDGVASASGQVTANDADATDTLSYAGSASGSYGGFAVDAATGAWTYTLDNAAAQPLAAGQSVTETFTLTAADGQGGFASQQVSVTITGVNDAPVVLGSAGTVRYTETSSAVPIDPALSIGDVDGGTLAGATVRIIANFAAGEDVLQFSPTANISGSWDATTGTLTLAGTATLTEYQIALRTVSYANLSAAPSTAARTVAFVVDDGSDESAPAVRAVMLDAVNDAPVNTLPADVTTAEDTPVRLTGLALADADAGTGPMTLTLQVSSGTLNAAAQGGVTVSGSGTAALTLQGTLDALNPYLAGATAPEFAPLADFNGDVTLWMISSDLGNSGAGGVLGDIDTATIRVMPVNDAPRIVSGGGAAQIALQQAENTNAVTVVVATDVDLPAQGLSFSVAGGADGALFGIDALTGALSWRASPDYERPSDVDGDNVYEVVVQVTDSERATAQQRISVRVADANDAPTVQLPESVQLLERQSNGTLVAQVQAADQDAGQVLSFRLLDDAAGRFAIDAATGRISVADGLRLDARYVRELTLIVQVSDGQGGTEQRQLKIALVAVPPDGPQPEIPRVDPTLGLTPPLVTSPAPVATTDDSPIAEDARTDEQAGTSAGGEQARRPSLLGDDVGDDDSGGPRWLRDADKGGGEQVDESLLGKGQGTPLVLLGGQQTLTAPVSLELTRALLAQALDVTSDISSAVSELVGRAWSTGNRGANGEYAASDDVFAPRGTEEQRPPAERLLIQLTQPEHVTGITLVAGLVWWITRGGGLLATALMGVPAWRQVDLLPVASGAGEDDEDDLGDEGGASPGQDVQDRAEDQRLAAEEEVDALFAPEVESPVSLGSHP